MRRMLASDLQCRFVLWSAIWHAYITVILCLRCILIYFYGQLICIHFLHWAYVRFICLREMTWCELAFPPKTVSVRNRVFRMCSTNTIGAMMCKTLSTVGTLSDLPWIKPSDFMTSMARTGDFSRLLGGMSVEQATSTLKVFWQRYHDVFPNHELFNSHLVDHLHQCVPVYCHGDEGTGYKKKGVLIISFQAALGHGGRHAPNSKDPCCETVPFML